MAWGHAFEEQHGGPTDIDSPGVAEFRSEYLPGAGFDPLRLLSSLATVTDQIGLIATVSTTYS